MKERCRQAGRARSIATPDQLVADAKKRAHVEVLRRQRRDPPALPTPAEITAKVFELEERIATEPLAGREALRALLDGGVIQMEPLPERGYVARCGLLPLVLFGKTTPQDFHPGAVPSGSSGGAIAPLAVTAQLPFMFQILRAA